jgi:aquaporin Z
MESQKYVAELLGTAFVVFIGAAAIVTTGGNPLVAALAFGLAWTGMWWVFGHVSGGHFNPAITIANFVARRTDSKDLIPYIVCQIIGGILGSVLLYAVLTGAPQPLAGSGLATTLAAPTTAGWTTTSILVLELVLTAALSLVWLAATEKTSATGITGLGIGLAATAVTLAGMTATWSALNPVRTLGPALLAHASLTSMWALWVGPIVGAIVGAGLWISVVQPARTSTTSSYTAEA